MKPPILALLSLLLSGCARRLPNVKASEISQRVSVMGVVSTAEANGISVTDTTIRAANARWTLSFPGFDQTTTAKDFQQRRDKEKELVP